jgi:hypothetical protein
MSYVLGDIINKIKNNRKIYAEARRLRGRGQAERK